MGLISRSASERTYSTLWNCAKQVCRLNQFKGSQKLRVYIWHHQLLTFLMYCDIICCIYYNIIDGMNFRAINWIKPLHIESSNRHTEATLWKYRQSRSNYNIWITGSLHHKNLIVERQIMYFIHRIWKKILSTDNIWKEELILQSLFYFNGVTFALRIPLGLEYIYMRTYLHLELLNMQNGLKRPIVESNIPTAIQ